MKTMKGNNKGFSLVELIVVMAIMAILAVTLAPRLGHYIEKARKSSDREVVSTVYTAVKYALADTDLCDVALSASVAADAKKGLNGTETKLFEYKSCDLLNTIYPTATGKTYSLMTFDSGAKTDKFFDEIKTVVGNSIKLKSNDAKGSETLTIAITDQNTFSVTLDYDGSTTTTDDQIKIDSAD